MADESASGTARSAVLQTILWIVLVPICLIGLGLWQVQRGAETVREQAQAAAELPGLIERAKQVTANGRFATFRVGRQNYAGPLAITKLEQALVEAEQDGQLARARPSMAWVTVAGGAMALLAGLGGLLLASLAGLAARRSRDRLIAGFGLVRTALPFLLAGQVLGLAVCSIGAASFEVTGFWFSESLSGNAIRVAGVGLGIVAVALYSAYQAIVGLRQVFALHAADPIAVSGRRVGPAEAPGLWRFVSELARRQQALAPDAIVIGLTGGFFVTETPVLTMPEEQVLEGRTLYLPAPYFGLLDGRELAAILGHELAHFSGEDTAYSQRFAPIWAGLARAVATLHRGEDGTPILVPAARLGLHAIQAFDGAVARWSRVRELEADRLGSLVSGPEAQASALLRTGAIQDHVAAALDHAAEHPAEAPPDLVADVIERVAVEGLGDPAAHVDDRQPHPTDSHPPVGRRLQALGVVVDDALTARAARAAGVAEREVEATFFADWSGLCRRLSADFLADAEHDRAAEQAWLKETAEAAPTDVTPLYENGRVMAWTMAGIVGLVLANAVAAALYPNLYGVAQNPPFAWALAGIATLCVLVAGAIGWWMHRRSVVPFLTLSPEGLTSPLLKDRVSWTDVVDHRVLVGTNMTLELLFADKATLPAVKFSRLRIGLSRRRHSLCVTSTGVQGMKPDEYSDLVARYAAAAHARAALSRERHGSPTRARSHVP